MFFLSRKKEKEQQKQAFVPVKFSKDKIKQLTKVLIIDDLENDLHKNLNTNGWTTNYLNDLASLDDPQLKNSCIICVDINGVGKLLHFQEEGMGLAKAIKTQYPEKKIILYSSKREHNIFSDSIEFIDRRLYKSGEVFPFIQAIQELAQEIFDWDSCLDYLYDKYNGDFTKPLSSEDFKKLIEHEIAENKISEESLTSIVGVITNSTTVMTNATIIITNVINFCLQSQIV